MSCCEEKFVPNLREYTLEETADLAHKWIELGTQGNSEEAEKIALEIPLLPGLANNLKEEIGIQALIASGQNLSHAVREYGHGWLEQ